MKKYVLAALAATLASAGANAAVLVTYEQVGVDVVSTLSGTLNTSGTFFFGRGDHFAYTSSSYATVEIGAGQTTANGYYGFTGPSSFGGGGFVAATTTTGDVFGSFYVSFRNATVVRLKDNYVSGAALAATAIYANQTLAGLGLAAGDIVLKSAADTITYRVVQPAVVTPIDAAVPEPATWAMTMLGFGALGYAMRRKKVSTRVRFA